jgi:hypothetical protein
MTVQELTEKLSSLKPGLKVVVYNDEGWDDESHYDKNFDVFPTVIGEYGLGGGEFVVVIK